MSLPAIIDWIYSGNESIIINPNNSIISGSFAYFLCKNLNFSTYLFEITSVFAKPVTLAFDSDEFILTGPSPWKILIRFNFIGSIDSIAVKPSIPITDTENRN